MTLQEQIARRLAKMEAWEFDQMHEALADAYMNRAAEVIRWMEWAFVVGVSVGRGYTSRHGLPLTLPPEGWTP